MNLNLTLPFATLAIFLPFALSQPIKAQEADDFIDSIGVNIHLNYYNTPYTDFEGRVVPSLEKLGVRHVRDGICPVEDTTKPERLKLLATKLEIQATLIVDPRCEEVTEALTHVKEILGTDIIKAVEGPNEYDLSGEPDWVQKLRIYQKEIYSAFNGETDTMSSLPVIGPSVTSESAADALGSISQNADILNLHNYYSFRPPETNGWGDNGYGSFAWQMNEIARPLDPAGLLPVIVTETGYHNVIADDGIPETVAGMYVPRLLLNNFSKGISRTFIYELLDEWNEPDDREANFGLIRYDGTYKPAFVAVSNLISLLEDAGASFTPGTLDVTFRPTLDTLSWTLLQKRNGIFYLALWDHREIFNPADNNLDVYGVEQTVSLEFGEKVSKVSQVKLSQGKNWRPLEFNGSSLNVTVSAEVTMLQIIVTPK